MTRYRPPRFRPKLLPIRTSRCCSPKKVDMSASSAAACSGPITGQNGKRCSSFRSGSTMPTPYADADPPLGLSVIIPVLNEEAVIGRCIRAVQTSLPDAEILVADGASSDRTVETAREFRAVRVIQSAQGRALQMNAGAAVAQGDVLLFLHADVQLP